MPKAAILIDGGYFLRRIRAVLPAINPDDLQCVADALRQLVNTHLKQLNKIYKVPESSALLYRTFYYDARPYSQKAHTPVDKRAIDYARSREAQFRTGLFDILYGFPNLAVRLGEVRKNTDPFWTLRAQPQDDLLAGRTTFQDLTDKDFVPSFRQKGVDMRIGLDIASITLKRQAEIIVLVSGDADFVPAAKMARREGIQFILDPLWQNIPGDLFEHIDVLRSGVPKPPSRNSR